MGKSFEQVDAFVGPIATAVIAVIVIGYLWRLITWTPHKG